MHALDPVQYSYNAEYLSAVTRTVGFYSHLYVALNVWANVWAETSYSCISVIFNLCAKQRTPKCVRRRVVQDRHQERRQCMLVRGGRRIRAIGPVRAARKSSFVTCCVSSSASASIALPKSPLPWGKISMNSSLHQHQFTIAPSCRSAHR